MFPVTLTLLSADKAQALQVARHECKSVEAAQRCALRLAEKLDAMETKSYSVTAWNAEGLALVCYGNG